VCCCRYVLPIRERRDLMCVVAGMCCANSGKAGELMCVAKGVQGRGCGC